MEEFVEKGKDFLNLIIRFVPKREIRTIRKEGKGEIRKGEITMNICLPALQPNKPIL